MKSCYTVQFYIYILLIAEHDRDNKPENYKCHLINTKTCTDRIKIFFKPNVSLFYVIPYILY